MTEVFLRQIYGLAKWTEIIAESEIRRLLRVKGIKYYFAGGKPGVLPVNTLIQILHEIAEEQEQMLKQGKLLEVVDLWNYGLAEGWPPLRQVLAERMRRTDGLDFIPKDPEEAASYVTITTGSQQALYALCDIMIEPGDVIITTEPIYLGFLGPAMRFGARLVMVSCDEKGIIPEAVEGAIKKVEKEFNKKPDMIYIVADSDNPTGKTLPLDRRKKLYEIAASHEILLVEDAAYREIQFGGKRLPTIKSFDKENKWVMYLRTSSKEAFVARIGYYVAPDPIRKELIKAKGYMDLCTPMLMQIVLKKYYEKYIDKVLPDVVKEYEKRAKVMEKAIDESFPEGWHTTPTGGFFIWYEHSKKDFDSKVFLEKVAIPNAISYVPGMAFYPLPQFAYIYDVHENKLYQMKEVPTHTMRLSYSLLPENMIDEGIRLLGKLLKEHS